ncbi:hypothetical protein PY650_28075 [Rhizobium calliandrae]|uniref:Uncharacterized protein n=1 Tax=Rhizobium calliandrae TaxID=1312182 RepID=A0ABT7KLX2_9HYPH|nr:hypothetical protein [Rhizobium calliandrae]MDL2409421.1 hypothetical protein [Rhizobium calliandrae]
MVSDLTKGAQKRILIFLPKGAAHVIATKLAENGYEATVALSVPEVFDALRSDRYGLAVTTRPDIDIVRNMRSIPVVNLEVFFHAVPSESGLVTSSKQFDDTGFLQRIKALIEPRPGRTEPTQPETAPIAATGASAEWPFRWLASVRSLIISYLATNPKS